MVPVKGLVGSGLIWPLQPVLAGQGRGVSTGWHGNRTAKLAVAAFAFAGAGWGVFFVIVAIVRGALEALYGLGVDETNDECVDNEAYASDEVVVGSLKILYLVQINHL